MSFPLSLIESRSIETDLFLMSFEAVWISEQENIIAARNAENNINFFIKLIVLIKHPSVKTGAKIQ